MRRALALTLALVALAGPARAQTVARTIGKLTMSADLGQAYPGGLIVARLRSRGRLGTVYAILDGRRALFYDTPRGPRALVPIPAGAVPGPDTLGVELFARSGRQRLPLAVEVAPRDYPPRTLAIPETRRHLPGQPSALTQGRQLLLLLRTETREALWNGPFRAPVEAAPVASFGSPHTYLGGSPIESLADASFGERHRGLDYEVPVGTLVQAPAAGSVLAAGPRTLLGQTLVLDHGQGVVSVLTHLSRLEVREGERVEARAPLGLSGDSGIAYGPHVHWAVYVHGVPVDPRVFEQLID